MFLRKLTQRSRFYADNRTDAVRTAGELRAEHSLKMVVRAMDLFHIAIATEIGADALLSFDTDQIALAQAAGLTVVNLAQKSP